MKPSDATVRKVTYVTFFKLYRGKILFCFLSFFMMRGDRAITGVFNNIRRIIQ